MYKKKKEGWLKHLDFILWDIFCLQLAFLLAYGLRMKTVHLLADPKYLELAIVFLMVNFCIIVVFETFKNVLKRGLFRECCLILKQVFLVEGFVAFFLFAAKRGDEYSRIFFFILGPLYAVLTFVVRYLWKRMLKRKHVNADSGKSLIIIAHQANLEECIANICELDYNAYSMVGAVVMDAPMKGNVVRNVPVVANYEEVTDYICREWVDEVFVAPEPETGYPVELMEKLHMMGVVTHMAIAKVGDISESKQQVERLGKYTVLTTSLNHVPFWQLFFKRLMDIVGGLVGCLITVLLIIIIGPMIYISSPGPIFFSQERVGRNGKKFKMYKFRSMYPDAEERKAELMEKNRVKDGMMFKLDFDPRIIGSKQLPDGTVKKGVGNFIRDFSLDEFPQFLNVLVGTMSLCGTRPPTVDEWERYELHQRARLAIKPGITGLWQVSGRSNITDFEEVVKLDKKYISEWNLGLDFKILLKTVKSVVGKNGAM